MRPRNVPLVLMAPIITAGCLVNNDLYEEKRAAMNSPQEWSVSFASDSDCIEIDARQLDITGPFTLEIYLKADAGLGGGVYPLFAWPGMFAVYQDEEGWLVAGPGTVNASQDECARGPETIINRDYHHVAVNYSQSQKMSLYADGVQVAVDGDKVGAVPVILPYAPEDYLYLGCWPDMGGTLAGDLIEVRLSQSALYAEDKEPPWTPYEVEPATVSLWHLDEGQGTDIVDEVGVADGVLESGEWVAISLDGERP